MAIQAAELLSIISKPMPFGKYKGLPLLRLPMAYLCWLERKTWPAGQLGAELALVYELKLNGVDKGLYSLLERG
ncbi:putative quorum-sensing-regulated virulence factor [Zobellella sp. DQSA1]|uniref:putative quorum-sensing-regulated virulence factor n=1 Tax=Zobellella sp. DQSA1 TaxID=3342386 RepID=UPI0035C187CC